MLEQFPPGSSSGLGSGPVEDLDPLPGLLGGDATGRRDPLIVLRRIVSTPAGPATATALLWLSGCALDPESWRREGRDLWARAWAAQDAWSASVRAAEPVAEGHERDETAPRGRAGQSEDAERLVASAALDLLPGAAVLGELALVDPQRLSHSARVDLVRALDRQASWLAALQHRACLAVADAVHDVTGTGPREGWAADELAAALRITPRSAAARLETAYATRHLIPDVVRGLETGRITATQALVLADELARFDLRDPVLLAEAQARLVPIAGDLTPGRLRAKTRATVIALDPGAAARRREAAIDQETGVRWRGLPDGLGSVSVVARADVAAGIYRRIDAVAQALPAKHPDGSRWRIGARRVHALRTLLAGGPGDVATSQEELVAVVIDLPTVLGLADNPAQIPGYGPVDPDLARELAADRDWVRWVRDPVTGHLLDDGDRRYAGRRLARFVRRRDGTCRHPNGSQPAHRCDLDHARPWGAGGPTDTANLHALAPRYNRRKDEGGWTIVRAGADGSLRWRSPLGVPYDVPPREVLESAPPPEPAPPGS
ncbi:MAG: DUF222 domain-containing protein [Candidatus Nanopelagicales bacterium]